MNFTLYRDHGQYNSVLVADSPEELAGKIDASDGWTKRFGLNLDGEGLMMFDHCPQMTPAERGGATLKALVTELWAFAVLGGRRYSPEGKVTMEDKDGTCILWFACVNHSPSGTRRTCLTCEWLNRPYRKGKVA